MFIIENTATGKGGGVKCFLAGDAETHSTTITRRQSIMRLGVPHNRADLIARLAYGDTCMGESA